MPRHSAERKELYRSIPITERTFATKDQIGVQFCWSYTLVDDLIRAGHLRTQRFGKRVLVRVEDAMRLAQRGLPKDAFIERKAK